MFGSFPGFESNGAMTWLRQWVASPSGRRMGLEPIPDEPVHPRRLRRTLSVKMAARPGGLLATKVHFKHLQVATSEGCTVRQAGRRPGCLPPRVEEGGGDGETRTDRRGIPAVRTGPDARGPGADTLLASFRTVEQELVGHEPGPAKGSPTGRSSCF
ncbi:hypothetical protein ACFQ51_54340 [Streptomyces kaempferi]